MLADLSPHRTLIAPLPLLRRGEEPKPAPAYRSRTAAAGDAAIAPSQPHSEAVAGLGLAQFLAGAKRLQFIARLVRPGEVSPQLVLGFSVLAMIGLTGLDGGALPAAMRLDILHLFPLAAIALHCARRSTLVASLGLSLALQLQSFVLSDAALVAGFADGVITVATLVLAMLLARAARVNYLATMSLATTDWLTGLCNRRSFEAAAEGEISRQRRYGGAFSLAVLDLDGFKQLNDTRGHAAGDAALKQLADLLTQHVRRTDLVARLGGDEFAVLMPHADAAACLVLCRQLPIIIASRMRAAGFAVTASIGCASFDAAPASTGVALARADAALYAAKARGKNCTMCG